VADTDWIGAHDNQKSVSNLVLLVKLYFVVEWRAQGWR